MISVLNVHNRFANDTDYVIARALSAGIFKMVVTGNTLKKSRVAVSLSKTRPGFLYAAVGVHPHWSQKEWSDNSLKVYIACLIYIVCKRAQMFSASVGSYINNRTVVIQNIIYL